MMNCNVDCKRFTVTVLAVFAFIWGFEFLFHGFYMADLYEATKHLWRPEAEMQDRFILLIGGQLLIAVMFCWIFAKGHEGRGIMEGVRYGVYIALLFAGPHLIMHAVAPYPTELTLSWIGGGFVEMILAGMVAASIYRPKA